MTESPYKYKLRATKCLCCGRKLDDPNSIKNGIGPVCIKKYGYGTADGVTNLLKAKLELTKLPSDLKNFIIDVPTTNDRGEDIYAMASKLVYNISAMAAGVNRDLAAVAVMLNSLKYLGFETLAEKVTARTVEASVVRDDAKSELLVSFDYNPSFISALKTIPYTERRYIPEEKKWGIKYTAAKRLYEIVKAEFGGKVIYSEKEGLFVV